MYVYPYKVQLMYTILVYLYDYNIGAFWLYIAQDIGTVIVTNYLRLHTHYIGIYILYSIDQPVHLILLV